MAIMCNFLIMLGQMINPEVPILLDLTQGCDVGPMGGVRFLYEGYTYFERNMSAI
jgi:hypothetical protein